LAQVIGPRRRSAFDDRREENEMSSGRAPLVSLASAALLLPACGGGRVEVNPIVPAMKVSRGRVPQASALEVTYTWTVEAGAKKIPPNYRAFAHFLDSRRNVLFADDHTPVPPPDQWEPGQTYSYARTVFVPVSSYLGETQLVLGLYPGQGRGERIALKEEDIGMRAYRVGKLELVPETENLPVAYREGWHGREPHPQDPRLERMWTKKEAVFSFKNPQRDVIVYLEADTCSTCFPKPPVLTVSVGGKTGLTVPIDNSLVFLKKIRFKAADLGTDEWVDLRLAMNQSFVPKLLTPPTSQDARELGLLVYHLYVGEADKLGSPPNVVDAGPVAPPAAPATAGASRAVLPRPAGVAPKKP
jgi:hypothetical protein